MYDLIIIGSGPAGLAAAIYAQRAKLDTLVLERAGISGGQVLTTYEVDNYPALPGIGGIALSQQMREHADKLGAIFEEEEVQSIEDCGAYKKVICEKLNYETKCVIIATGAKHAKLQIPGEDELAGMGVSYCATCDGAFFKDRTVAVVGGGDVAVEDAIFLARICRKVYLIHRRDELRAAASLQETVLSMNNVEPLWNCAVQGISGSDRVEEITVLNKKTNEITNLSVNGIFIAVGIHPNTEAFIPLLSADQGGYLIAGEDCATNVAGIYVAGDARKKPLRQIVTAVADGANAVNSAQEFLRTL